MSIADVRQENLEQLAERLIARHLRIAVQDSSVRDLLVAKQTAGYTVSLVEREMRCIAVVGAGASWPLLDRSEALAAALEAEFGRNEAELERLRLVNNLASETFETRLVALSTSPPAERAVRKTISRKYGVRYPSVLGYELLAHLLKHRFLDAIVSFNFDELLDQALDDELDEREYHQVISERDCDNVETDPGARDYVPVYVKLHGTASEPESLRFTPHSYYEIPPRISQLVRDLLRCEHCVVANVGSNLGSFDFQRLLALPQRLEVFNLSYDKIPAPVRRKIRQERKRAAPDDPPDRWLLDCSGLREQCNDLLSDLTEEIERKSRAAGERGLVAFRSVQRHRALAQLLGADTMHRTWTAIPAWAEHEQIAEREALMEREQILYCWRRTIFELALAGAKARGLLSLGSLAFDRPARYYDRYRQLTNGRCDDWSTLCSAAGLEESRQIPDILLSQPHLRKQRGTGGTRLEEWQLHEFAPKRLARHVLERIKNPYCERDDLRILAETIAGLQRTSDVEFHMRDDRVCSKAFKRPVTLPAATSLRAYTRLMLRGLAPHDEVFISAETGGWLLEPAVHKLLRNLERIKVLLAFDIEQQRIADLYRGVAVESVVVDPWRHNRHMTIVCREGRPTRAIYFARRLRAPVITAVYLESMRDVERLMRLYQLRWEEAVREEEERRSLHAVFDAADDRICVTVGLDEYVGRVEQVAVHERAVATLHDGQPVKLEMRTVADGVEEPLATFAESYRLDADALGTVVRLALTVPGRAVVLGPAPQAPGPDGDAGN